MASYDPVFKVNPPLRTERRRGRRQGGLADGMVDAIATDHAPHTQETKEAPVRPGAPGDARAGDGGRRWPSTELDLPIEQVIGLLSWQPAAIAGLTGRATAARSWSGAPANLCVIDPTETWTVEPAAWPAGAATPPTPGAELTGRVRHTVLRGEPVVVGGEAQR